MILSLSCSDLSSLESTPFIYSSQSYELLISGWSPFFLNSRARLTVIFSLAFLISLKHSTLVLMTFQSSGFKTSIFTIRYSSLSMLSYISPVLTPDLVTAKMYLSCLALLSFCYSLPALNSHPLPTPPPTPLLISRPGQTLSIVSAPPIAGEVQETRLFGSVTNLSGSTSEGPSLLLGRLLTTNTLPPPLCSISSKPFDLLEPNSTFFSKMPLPPPRLWRTGHLT